MTRDALLHQLKRHHAYDDHEESMLAAMLRFIEEHPRCCERTLSIGHMTGSAWVLDDENCHVLLTHHRKLNRWLQLGGHADGDMDLLRVALREAYEESGITQIKALSSEPFDIDIHLIPARGNEPEHLHYDVRFLFQADKDEPLQVSHESNQLAWIPLAEFTEIQPDAALQRMAEKTKLLFGASSVPRNHS